jgi:large subunit ribosomal protein L27
MGFVQLQRPLGVAATGICGVSLSTRIPRLLGERLSILPAGRRYASVKAQGQYKLKPTRTHPKKLGAKRTGGMSNSFPSFHYRKGISEVYTDVFNLSQINM